MQIVQKLPIIYVAHSGPPQFFDKKSEHNKRLASVSKIIEPLKSQIKCVIFFSPHYESKGSTLILGLEQLNTIHDHGFEEFMEFQYSPRGDPNIAKQIQETLTSVGIKAEVSQKWGADHAVWMVMAGLYENAKDLNIVVISVDVESGEQNIAQIGRSLSHFREQGCLIIGSGALTHNFDAFRTKPGPKLDLLLKQLAQFDQWTQDTILNNQGKQRTDALLKFRKHSCYQVAHHSDEHWLPIIFSCAAGEDLKVEQIWRGEDLPGFYCHAYLFS